MTTQAESEGELRTTSLLWCGASTSVSNSLRMSASDLLLSSMESQSFSHFFSLSITKSCTADMQALKSASPLAKIWSLAFCSAVSLIQCEHFLTLSTASSNVACDAEVMLSMPGKICLSTQLYQSLPK